MTSGAYWHWTRLEAWMLAIWAIYMAYLHVGRWRGWAIAAVVDGVNCVGSWNTLAEPRARETLKLISVIIPCYNQGRFLDEAIQSALNQDYPRKEVIVTNDGAS